MRLTAVAMKKYAAFVIGANATGKSTFIQTHFSDTDAVILDVYHYQKRVFREAGVGMFAPKEKRFQCLYRANEKLLADIIEALRQGKNVVAEQTLFKAKRRIAYIDRIRQAVENVCIEVYVICPSDTLWEANISKRGLFGSFQSHKEIAAQLEFPNPSEGIDAIYEVVDDDIRSRMDAPNDEIVDIARKELWEEALRLRKEE